MPYNDIAKIRYTLSYLCSLVFPVPHLLSPKCDAFLRNLLARSALYQCWLLLHVCYLRMISCSFEENPLFNVLSFESDDNHTADVYIVRPVGLPLFSCPSFTVLGHEGVAPTIINCTFTYKFVYKKMYTKVRLYEKALLLSDCLYRPGNFLWASMSILRVYLVFRANDSNKSESRRAELL